MANSDKNGYAPQPDSDDDQRSIWLGFAYANSRHYASRVQHQWGKPRVP